MIGVNSTKRGLFFVLTTVSSLLLFSTQALAGGDCTVINGVVSNCSIDANVVGKMKPTEVTEFIGCYNAAKAESFQKPKNPIDDNFEKLIGWVDKDKGHHPSDLKTGNQNLIKDIESNITQFATSFSNSDPSKRSKLLKTKEFSGNVKACPLANIQFPTAVSIDDAKNLQCASKTDFRDDASRGCKLFSRIPGISKGGVRSVLAGSVLAAFAEELKDNPNIKTQNGLPVSNTIAYPSSTSQSSCYSASGLEAYAKNYCAFQAMKKSPEIAKDCFSENSSSTTVGDCSTSTYLRNSYRAIVASYAQMITCRVKELAIARHEAFRTIVGKTDDNSALPGLTRSNIDGQIHILQNGACHVPTGKVDCIKTHYSDWAYDQLQKAFNKQYPSFTCN